MSHLHDDELVVDLPLVRGLVDRAFPQFRGQALRTIGDTGSSNRLYRLGDDALVRLPRQPGRGDTVEKEATWLPYVAPRLTVQVPVVIGLGDPTPEFPERWAVTRWLDGERPRVPSADTRGRTTALATGLVRFLTELRAMPISDAAVADERLRRYRGQPLWNLDADFRAAVDECRSLDSADPGLDSADLGLDFDGALRVWDEAVGASRGRTTPDAWFHGDMFAENLLVDGTGELSAVLDFGGLAIGDPSVDLIVAWEVLDAEGRRLLREGLGVDDATWAVSRGWALLIAMITFPYYWATMPARCADRLVMARAAIDGV